MIDHLDRSLVPATPSNLPAVAADLNEWGVQDQHLGQDVLLSKILPMQGSSVMVGEMKAQVGEFRDSVSGKKIGSIIEPFELIPFHVTKSWDIMEEQDDGQGGKTFKYSHSEPLIENPAQQGYNDNLAWTDTVEGTPIKRTRRMDFYCLLPGEVANGESVPYIMSFKSTSYREGKKIFTQMFVRNTRAKLPPPAYLFKIAGIKQKNAQNQTWIIPTVELSRKATPQEIGECLEWYKTVSGRKPGVKVAVDDSDLHSKHEAPPPMAEGNDSGVGDF